jgi:hypothetical protein
MTISTTANKTIALGNGSQTQFAFSFIGVAAAYIGVIFTDASGNETVLSQGAGASQYQIALNPAVEGALWGVGGTVTYDPLGTPIAPGTSLTIFRTLPLTQAISLQNLVSLSSLGNGAETGLDTLEMQLQQISEEFGRSIVAPIVDPATINLTLPAAAQRANTGLAFDGQGNVIAGTTPASGTISSTMQPVVNAASLAAGRTAFGLAAMAVEGIGAGLQDDGSGNARVNFTTVADATNQGVTAAFHLTQRIATGPIIYTLPRANTLWNGFGFFVFAIAGNITITPNASDNFSGLSGGQSIAVPQGSWAWISTNAAATGVWYANYNSENISIAASVNANALTVSLNATALKFRDPTLTAGDPIPQNIPANLSITVPTGASLGSPGSSTPFRLWVFVARNNGNPVLGLATGVSVTGGTPAIITMFPLGSWETDLNTGIGISAGSTAAGTLYTSSGVANDVVRLLGYISFSNGQATAGTWASAPTKVESISPAMKRPGDIIQAAMQAGALAFTPRSKENIIRVKAIATAQLGTSGVTATSFITRNASQIGVSQIGGATSSAFNQDVPVSLEALDAPGANTSQTYGVSTTNPTGILILAEELMA